MEIKKRTINIKNPTTGEWEQIPALQGEKGEKGERGLQGPKGDTGATGPKGDKGDNKVAYGTCSTAAATAEKEVVVDDSNWKLEVGSIVAIKYSATNSASNVTINVNDTGAYPIWASAAEYTSTGSSYTGYANRTYTYMFNGTHWVWMSNGMYPSSTTNASLGHGYGVCSTAEATLAKACTISSYTLSAGGSVSIKFTNAVPANSTLNIRTRGAKKIFYKGSAIIDGIIKAGDTATFVYDGTQYQLVSIDSPKGEEVDLTNYATKQYVQDELAKFDTSADIVDSVDEMTDTSKTYIHSGTGTWWRYKTVNIEAGGLGKFTNLLDMETAEVIINKRYNGSTQLVDAPGMAVIKIYPTTDMMAQFNSVDPCYFRVKGMSLTNVKNHAESCRVVYDMDAVSGTARNNNTISQIILYEENLGTFTVASSPLYNNVDNTISPVQAFKLGYRNATVSDNSSNIKESTHSSVLKHGIAISGIVNYQGSNPITEADMENVYLSWNEPILADKATTISEWCDTGIEYKPGEDSTIVNLDLRVSDLEERVEELESRPVGGDTNTNPGTSTEEVKSALPTYWKTYLDDLEEKMKTLQDEGGVNTLQFVWASDVHGVNGASNTNGHGKSDQKYIGEIARYVMDKYNIPFFAISGDVMSQASHSTEQAIWNEYEAMKPMFEPIMSDEFFTTKGNHDCTWGAPFDVNGDGTMDYYTKNLGVEKTFRAVYKKGSKDRTKIYGEDGMYYYVDFAKHRFYMLNTHTFGDDSVDEDGYSIYNGFKHSVYGTKQLQWIADTLMTVRADQSVIFMGHAPITVMVDQTILNDMLVAYRDRTSIDKSMAITGAFWGTGTSTEYNTSKVKADFTNAKGTVCAYFNGHIHNDTITTNSFFFPMISITTSSADVRDTAYTCERIPGTITETAMDIVSITPKTITMTRIGAGRDRTLDRATKTVTYGEVTQPPAQPDVELTQGNITREVGVTFGQYYAGGDTEFKAYADSSYATTGIIDVVPGDVIRIKGFSFPSKSSNGANILFYENETHKKLRSMYVGCSNTTGVTFAFTGTDEVAITVTDSMLNNSSNVGSFKGTGIAISNVHNGTSPIIITRNAEITSDMVGIAPSGGNIGGDTEITQGEITTQVTWQENTRLSSSSGNYSTANGICASSDIKVTKGDVIRVYGATGWTNYAYVCAYSDTAFLNMIDMYGGNSSNNLMIATRTTDTHVLTVTIQHDSVSYIRICNGSISPSTARVFKNAELEK